MALRKEQHRQLDSLGWSYDGMCGSGHIRLRRDADGAIYTATSSGDRNAWKNCLRDLAKINSGTMIPRQRSRVLR